MLYCALGVNGNCCYSGYHIIPVMRYCDMVVLVTVHLCYNDIMLHCIVLWVFTAIVAGVVYYCVLSYNTLDPC